MNLSKLLKMIFFKQAYSVCLNLRFKLSYKRFLVIIAEEDEELNYLALMHLDEFVKKSYIREVIIATTSSFVAENAKKISKFCKCVVVMNFEQKRKFSECYQFGAKNMLMVSFKFPFGNMNENLIGVSNITKEDLICYCCYGLFYYKEVMDYKDFINVQNRTREMEKENYQKNKAK